MTNGRGINPKTIGLSGNLRPIKKPQAPAKMGTYNGGKPQKGALTINAAGVIISQSSVRPYHFHSKRIIKTSDAKQTAYMIGKA